MTLEPLPDAVAQETAAYRRALGAFVTGVCVVTADTDAGPLGITVNSFTSVSLKPRLVLWCLDERSERWPAFAAADAFSIHVLPARDAELAMRFARGLCTIGDHEFSRDGAGAPRLAGAVARFDCMMHDRVPMGDHLIIVGRVEGFEVEDGDTLTYFRGRYGAASEIR